MSIATIIKEKNYSQRTNIILEVISDFYFKYYMINNTKKISSLLKDVILIECGEEFLSFISKNLIGMEQTGKILPEEIVRSSKGIFYSSPVIDYNQDGYTLIGSRNLVAINIDTVDKTEEIIGLIAHELFFHAERAQNQEYKINGELITRKSGFCTEKGELSRDSYGNPKVEWFEMENLGIEEALATHFECEAVREITGNNEYSNTIRTYGPLLRIIRKWIELEPNIINELQLALTTLQINENLSLIFRELDNLIKLIYDGNVESFDLENKIIDLIKSRRKVR